MATVIDINKLFDSGESQIVEFKTSFGRETLETLVVFANAQGGSVLVGVAEEIGGSILVTFGQGKGVNEGVSGGVNRLYQSIMQKPGIRLPELSNKLHVPIKTLDRWIKQLRDDKKVIFKGSAKTGGYYIIDGDS